MLSHSEHSADLVYGTGLNIQAEKVRIYTPNADGLTKYLLANPEFATGALALADIEFVLQENPSTAAQYKYPYLNGGTQIHNCTMGYAVRRLSDNRRFVSTAGHCDNLQSVNFAGSDAEDPYLGPIIVENDAFAQPPVGPLGNAADIQVHNSWVRDFDLTNRVQVDATTLRRVGNSQPKANTLKLVRVQVRSRQWFHMRVHIRHL